MPAGLPDRAFSEIVRRGNRIIGTNAARLVQLDEERLLAEARRRADSSDFGEGEFREPLRRLLQSWDTEAELTLLGRIAARQDTTRLLVNRLRMQADRQRHPTIADEEIRQPLFVTGLPRTGTTLLHGLLAQDPANRVPLNWEVMLPSPPPERGSRGRDRRIDIIERQIRWFHRLAPEFRKIHPVGARLPEECLIINSHSFLSFQFQTSHHVPSYQSWLETQDLRPSYAMHRRVLQHLQWRARPARWVLKAPAHLYGIEAIFAVYPDAGVVFTHRDPLEVVPSMASLHTELRGTFSDGVDAHAVGREVTTRWARGIDLALGVRDGGCAPADRFLDIQYTDLVRQPLETVERLYRHFGMRFDALVEGRMRRFLLDSPKDKHGPHRYSLAQFGLDPDEERQRYRAYRERFGF